MASKDDDDIQRDDAAPAEVEGEAASAVEDENASDEAAADEAPAGGAPAATTSLGATRFVHVAFFAAALLAAFLASKMLGSAWGYLAEWPTAVRAVPALLSFSEDDRGGISLAAGAVVGFAGVANYYRRAEVRQWAADVASELEKVAWPEKEVVTNGTIVVVATSIIATIYVALLDKFWGFVTDLIYRV